MIRVQEDSDWSCFDLVINKNCILQLSEVKDPDFEKFSLFKPDSLFAGGLDKYKDKATLLTPEEICGK